MGYPQPVSGWIPLHWAALKGDENVAKLLIDAGTDINTEHKVGRTPLHLAKIKGRDELAEL